jgi:hypothetical protein
VTRLNHVGTLLATIAALVAGSGCIDDLPRGWKIADARVLGVRVEVVGAPNIAAPAPGDTARVSVVFAEPPSSEGTPIGWGVLVGTAFLGGDARPITFEVPIPDASTLGAARALTAVGLVCSEGEPTLVPGSMMPSCSAGTTRSTTLLYTLALARSDMPANQNPELGADFASLDGALWETPAETLPATACAASAGGGALPLVSVSTTAKLIRLVVADTQRESVLNTAGSRVSEAITLSHFTSDGELERQFSVFEGVTALAQEIEWTPTGLTPSADGSLVRFWFVARDGRGGLAFTTRAVCVVP